MYTFETLLHQELGKGPSKEELCKSIQRILERVLKVSTAPGPAPWPRPRPLAPPHALSCGRPEPSPGAGTRIAALTGDATDPLVQLGTLSLGSKGAGGAR